MLRLFCVSDCSIFFEFVICYQNKIFVFYFEVNCVKVFSMEGQFEFNIGNIFKLVLEDRNGVLNGFFGFFVDKYGNLIVCDFYNRRFQLFILDGLFVSKIEKQFRQGVGLYLVVVLNDNRVLMIDILGYFIYVFQ